jgi:hypothetical protein
MKFSEVVLSEGRKETLFDKYSDSFSMEQLDYLLNDEFIKRTNYKYADFILDRLVKFYNLTPGTAHIQDAIDVVKDFDRLGKNLEKKDINQYQSLGELKLILKDYTSKSQERKIDSDAKKIYEDKRILIVKPLSHQASCKYGAGTKWCTTQSSPGYFSKYSSGSNQLFYIIMKEFDINNKFYKIALHKSPSGEETWYDATDTAMPPREIDLLKVGLGKNANKAITDEITSNKNIAIQKVLDNKLGNHRMVVTNNFLGTGKPIIFIFKGSEITDESQAIIGFDMYLGEEKLEDGYIMASFTYTEDEKVTIYLDYGYSPFDEFEAPVEIKSLLYLDLNLRFIIERNPFEYLCNHLGYQIWRNIRNDENLEKYVLGDKKAWYPNRSSYGFTFERGKLIHQLVDYLDKGKEGNAIDFLVYAKKLTKRKLNSGKIEYIGKRGPITPKGYFSAFFASAVNAGILSYTRKNKKNILSKGKNFDLFKEGKLIPY